MTRRERVRTLIIGFATIAAAVGSRPARAQNMDALTAHALQFASQQLTATVAAVNDPTKFPRSTLSDGSWSLQSSSDWTAGFFPGCLWQMYGWTGGANWKTWAANWTSHMESQKNDTGSHDVGFKIFCSFGTGYKIAGDPTYPAIIRQGAQSLSTRYSSVVGCIRSWDNRHFPVIIDNMMNLEILFWSARNGGSATWRDMAVSHALHTRQNHVRADGSTYHLVDYDPATGAILSRGTVQGYSDNSTWARGQAWAVYGFTMAYRETGDSRFLDTARLVADYFINHLPADHVPYWDFDAPNIPNEPKDSSAGAIAASGLLELSTLVTDPAGRTRYRDAATSILASLCSPAYLAEGTTSRGILLHGVGNKPKGTEVDVSLIYGDYYFLEALLRYRKQVVDVAPRALELRLERAAPNPFSAATRIGFHLPSPSRVEAAVFDLRGAEVRRLAGATFPAGDHSLVWDGASDDGGRAPCGVYFVRLRACGASQTESVAFVR